MRTKKLIRLFMMTVCVFSCEALAEKAALNNHHLFLNKSDIPKTFTTPNQEALDKLNKSLQQEAANSYKEYERKEQFDRSNRELQRFREESKRNTDNYKRNNNIKSSKDRNSFSITIPLSK